MNKLALAIGVICIGCGGFASAAQEDAPAPVPAAAAAQATPAAPAARSARQARQHTRMRIIDDAQVDVRFYRNRTCPEGDGVIASSGASRSTAIFRKKTASSIGILDTPRLELMKSRTGMLSQGYYREYVLAPGQPVALQAGYVSGIRPELFVCRFPTYSFVPEQGTDYEVSTEVSDGFCLVRLGRIDVSEGKAKVLPMALSETANCEKGQ